MKLFFSLLLFIGGWFNSAFAQEIYQAHTHVSLVSEQDAVAAGQKFWVGLRFTLDDGWHVYWKNPGDSGLAPKMKWDLSPEIKVGDFEWPYPKPLNLGPLTSYGYEHEVLLLVPVKFQGDAQASKTINLQGKLEWLACKDICIPGHAKLALALPVVQNISGINFNNFKTIFDQTRQSLPQSNLAVMSHAVLDGNQWHLHIQTSSKNNGDIVFYPFRDDVIEHAAHQYSQGTSFGYQVSLTKSHIYQQPIAYLEGIAVNPTGWDEAGKIKAIIIKAPVEMAPAHVSFFMACLFALIGGLILNLMPCVLPVLSIKVLHLVERHPDRGKALRHSLVYALGILVSVWSLALLIFILKSLGRFAGWGFQFQSPVFVLVVALVLLILALNLFGVFEFSLPSMGVLPVQELGYPSSFISGVITTIVASPCTAPFMGTALTAALGQPNIVGFGIFTFLGLGLALPFILLSVFPDLLTFVPRPGPWMIHLKQFLGLILIACVIWLSWVFGIETGLGDLSRFYKPSHEIAWQSYSSGAVSQARQVGKGVFLDFTAAWCINCQVNDRLVLQNDDVVKLFKDKGIIAFKGDWTKYDPAITQALAVFGRDSIPVYIYYPPKSNAPMILPQIITPKIIAAYINDSHDK